MPNLISYLNLCEKLGPTTSIKVLSIIDYLLKYGSSGCIDEFKLRINLIHPFRFMIYPDDNITKLGINMCLNYEV